MILYDPKLHETLLVAWHYSLQADPEEHGQLFMEPLRNLTNLLGWAKDQVRLLISWDARGLTAAAWVEPLMAGAFFGTWLRKDYRDIRGLAFIRQAHDKALEHFEPLIAVTKRPELYEILLRLGYQYVGEIPGLFDGGRVKVYYLTKETRYGSGRRENQHIEVEQSLLGVAGPVRSGGAPAVPAVQRAGGGSAQNGRGKRSNPDRGKKRGRGKVGAIKLNGTDPAGAGAKRTRQQQLRPANPG